METKIQRVMDQRRRSKYKIFSSVYSGEKNKKSYYEDKRRKWASTNGQERYWGVFFQPNSLKFSNPPLPMFLQI